MHARKLNHKRATGPRDSLGSSDIHHISGTYGIYNIQYRKPIAALVLMSNVCVLLEESILVAVDSCLLSVQTV